MKRYKGYQVVHHMRVETKREAQALAEDLKAERGGMVDIEPLALDRCPGDKDGKGFADHAHMRYDGEKVCNVCGGHL